MAQSAVFISLQAVVGPSHTAPAISFMYLTSTIAVTVGLPAANAVMLTVLRRSLGARLPALGLARDEVRKVRTLSISPMEHSSYCNGVRERESQVD